jgi:hypothetical protein
MIPVGAHGGVVPMSFNTNPVNNNTTSNNGNPSNPQTTALKETLSQLVQRHIELCKKTLKVFAMAGRTLKLSEDSWAVLLKVILGITDYLLKEPSGEDSTLGVMNMGDELCDSLLQVKVHFICVYPELKNYVLGFVRIMVEINNDGCGNVGYIKGNFCL